MSASALTSVAIPSRRRGWSSTVRIRISSGKLLTMRCPCGMAWIGSYNGYLCTRDQVPLVQFPFPPHLRSRSLIALQFAARARGFLPSPSVQDVGSPQGLWDPDPSHHPALATEADSCHSGSQLRFYSHLHAEKHFALLREQFCALRRGAPAISFAVRLRR